jgi:stalled ribosome alternative rescue factor ArfA
MASATITISMEKKCVNCSKGGACDNGLCLSCTADAINGKPMKTAAGRAIKSIIRNTLHRAKAEAAKTGGK